MDEVARLEALGAGEPGAPGFAALAEAHRRAGRTQRAIDVARRGLQARPDLVAGRVALALALLDQGEVDGARGELARVLEAVPDHALARRALDSETSQAEPEPFGGLQETELDHALASAEAERDQMIDANHVAAATLHSVERAEEAAAAESPFTNETMIGLLERQGHGERASELRGVMAAREQREPGGQGGLVVATLEQWLDNLRRGSR